MFLSVLVSVLMIVNGCTLCVLVTVIVSVCSDFVFLCVLLFVLVRILVRLLVCVLGNSQGFLFVLVCSYVFSCVFGCACLACLCVLLMASGLL